MPIDLTALAARISPQKTSLFLGAGASIPSGAPSGVSLARTLWAQVAKQSAQSEDLMETASYLSRQFGRSDVVRIVVNELKPLRPTGGMLAMPRFDWRAIYTTNFDKLVEKSFRIAGVRLVSLRSNYDFSAKESDDGLRLYKLHGCISQDTSFGHKASMTLTERDYEDHAAFRQAMFSKFTSDLLSSDVLIIGQSLRDAHLYETVKGAIKATEQGAPGKVYVLAYQTGDLRAQSLEDRGAVVVYGGLDELFDALAGDASKMIGDTIPDTTLSTFSLPAQLVSVTNDVSHAKDLPHNVTKMFNGAPASYADIHRENTFERTALYPLDTNLAGGKKFAVITGAAGVGKTTLARSIVLNFQNKGYLCWEHRSDFAFRSEQWISVEAELRAKGLKGILFVDECTHFMRAINQLADHLTRTDSSALQLVLTANAAQWTRRVKAKSLFTDGEIRELVQLNDAEINGLLNLLERNPQISALVQSSFNRLNRGAQFEQLRRKCSADMYVCLKNIFATENLDTILLMEFDELEQGLQEYYRYVAALESIGIKVHRQLVIRILNSPAAEVQSALDGLHGIIDEYDIKPREGIYGWSTRHIVIARKITEYKFSSSSELEGLFDAVIDNLNPAVSVELRSVRDICDMEHGIGRLPDAAPRMRLYRRLLEITPGERIPWHRLIHELLGEGDLEQVEFALRDARSAVGSDAPIDRYAVKLLIARSKSIKGISQADRVALLRKAYDVALQNTEKHRYNQTTFYTLCDVALELINAGEDRGVFDEALHKLRLAIEEIGDPDMVRVAQRYEDLRYKPGPR